MAEGRVVSSQLLAWRREDTVSEYLFLSAAPAPRHTQRGDPYCAPGRSVPRTSSSALHRPARQPHCSDGEAERQRAGVTALCHPARVWRGTQAPLSPKGGGRPWPVHHCVPSPCTGRVLHKVPIRSERTIQPADDDIGPFRHTSAFQTFFDTSAFHMATQQSHTVSQNDTCPFCL